MRSAEEYRRYAQECVELANTSQQNETRNSWLHMAQVWLRFAQRAEAEGREEAA
jgi:hypothetical protein